MTTPTTTQPDRITAEELRAEFAKLAHYYQDTRAQLESLQRETGGLRTNIEDLQSELAQMREGLTHAIQPAPAEVKQGENFTAIKIEREKRKGVYYYKMLGGRYIKHGVAVWPEVLEALGLDAVEYDENDTHKLTPPIEVHATAEYYIDPDDNQQKARRKVTGRA